MTMMTIEFQVNRECARSGALLCAAFVCQRGVCRCVCVCDAGARFIYQRTMPYLEDLLYPGLNLVDIHPGLNRFEATYFET
jgi:hypothetical protein